LARIRNGNTGFFVRPCIITKAARAPAVTIKGMMTELLSHDEDAAFQADDKGGDATPAEERAGAVECDPVGW
jgi:hypothetical protein